MRKKRHMEDYYEKKKVNFIVVVLYLIFGVYFVNFPFQLYPIPEIVSKFDSWIIFAGGVLILFGAINYFRVKRN
jgi:Mg2+ and Co2+ transporter CorA